MAPAPAERPAFLAPAPIAARHIAAQAAHTPAISDRSRWVPRRSLRIPCIPARAGAPTALSPPPGAAAATASASNGAPAPSSSSPPAGATPAADAKLSAAVRARTVTHICKSATLCTASTRHDGVPFGSHVDYVQDESGQPVFLLNAAANHTRNLTEEPRCSIYCQPSSTAGQDGCRATLVGSVSRLPDAEEDELREAYIETHAHAVDALKVPDFQFYRMTVDDVLFVAGYGVTSQWVDAKHYAAADPDPLAFDSPAIRSKLNETKEPDLQRLCRVVLGVENVVRCSMTALDHLGFDLRIRDDRGQTNEYRVAFVTPVQNRFDVQSAIVKAFQEAWERENGFDDAWDGDEGISSVVYFDKS